MNDIKSLLENEVLSEETKGALNEAIREQIESVKTEAVEQAKNELEAKYASKYEDEKQALAEKAFGMINELVKEEFEELKEDVEYYKNLEVDYAKRLQEFKEEYKTELAENFNNAVKEQVDKEFSELKEDIEEAKKNTLGRKIFEAFVEEANVYGLTEDDKQLRDELNQLKEQIQEKDEQLEQVRREKTMEGLLNSFEEGSKSREIMHSILENTDTDKLEEKYNSVVEKVISESGEKNDEENLTEDKDSDKEEGRIVNEDEDKETPRNSDWDRTVSLAIGRKRK